MQKNYNVFEIAELLDVNIETVRRWIRNNALDAQLPSRKEGNVITEEALMQFLKENPKYEKRARKKGFGKTSMVKIRLRETARPEVVPGIIRVHQRNPHDVHTQKLIVEALASQTHARSLSTYSVKPKNGEYMDLDTRTLVALVDTKQKEIDFLKHKLRAGGAKSRKSALKRK